MVKVRKGNMTLTIPAGAYHKYASAGWELESGSKTIKELSPSTDGVPEELEEEDVEYVDPEELAQRPLEDLDREELIILAEYKGIDVSEITSIKKLRSVLRSLE